MDSVAKFAQRILYGNLLNPKQKKNFFSHEKARGIATNTSQYSSSNSKLILHRIIVSLIGMFDAESVDNRARHKQGDKHHESISPI